MTLHMTMMLPVMAAQSIDEKRTAQKILSGALIELSGVFLLGKTAPVTQFTYTK